MQFIQKHRRSIATAIELLIVALLVMVLVSACSAQSTSLYDDRGEYRYVNVPIDSVYIQVVPKEWELSQFLAGFGFVSTSQFIVYPSRIEEYHRTAPISQTEKGVCVGTFNGQWAECNVIFTVDKWVYWNDSTVVGYGTGETRVEWQRRNGEQAVWVDFVSSDGEALIFQAYEFYRDTTLIRPLDIRK